MEKREDGNMLGLRQEVALVTNDDGARPRPRQVDVSAVL